VVGELQRLKAAASTTADQARYEGMALMFELALCTAMRLREIFTLTLDQIDVEWRTVFLKKTKNGWNRNVPLNSSAVELLSRSWPALEAARTSPQLLPFWNGNRKDHTLRQVSAELSAAFRKVFDSVGSFDLHFHDTRHEAVCRWVLEALVPLKDTFLSSAAGMTDAKTRDRYLSLLGHELAKMLA
jgi:integrase